MSKEGSVSHINKRQTCQRIYLTLSSLWLQGGSQTSPSPPPSAVATDEERGETKRARQRKRKDPEVVDERTMRMQKRMVRLAQISLVVLIPSVLLRIADLSRYPVYNVAQQLRCAESAKFLHLFGLQGQQLCGVCHASCCVIGARFCLSCCVPDTACVCHVGEEP